MDAFEEQQGNEVAADSGVTFADCGDIRANGFDNGGIVSHGSLHDFAELHGGECVGGQFAGQMIAHGILQAVVVQNRGVQKTGQEWFSRSPLRRTIADGSPEAWLRCGRSV